MLSEEDEMVIIVYHSIIQSFTDHSIIHSLITSSYRVVADHIRTLTMAITDGAVPSNTGRGYVLRRILRRGVRYGQEILKCKPGFFSGLVPVVVSHMKEAFPELEEKMHFVQEVILEEELSFNRRKRKMEWR